MTDTQRYAVWAGVVALGGLMALVDRTWIGRPLLGAILVLIAIGGLITMNVSPFTFGSGGHYMEGVIAMAGALMALGGYAFVAVYNFVRARTSGGTRS